MELPQLIEALSKSAAYPYPVDEVEVRQTHISVVFLAGPFVYKVKKPVNPGFLDFTTLDLRRHYCEEEVRLNRRLAPHVYLGVVPIAMTPHGVRLEAEGDVIEWAVKMQRLLESATFQARILRGEITVEHVETLARRIAEFHRTAATNERIAAFGRFEPVERTILDVFARAAPQIGATVSDGVFHRVKDLAEQALANLRPLIEKRAARGMTRDCHGDLHLDHAYIFPDLGPPQDLVIIDCIEFNERFRYIDPISDMAFLTMDFAFHGRRDLGRAFADAYFRATEDEEGRGLLPLYTAHRATVRGLVDGLKLMEPEVPEAERAAALDKGRARWLLALGELEAPDRRPALVLVGGLPGTGKSALSQLLAERANFQVIRSDVVRKQLAGLAPETSGRSEYDQGIYAPSSTERTYAECLRRAQQLLWEGQRVMIDATFGEEKQRQAFLAAARRLATPGHLILCHASPDVVRARLESRKGDASDADYFVYQRACERWEQLAPSTATATREVSTEGTLEEALAPALTALHAAEVSTAS